MIDVHYDEKEDVLGIQLKNGGYWKSVEVSKNVVMDLSKEGENHRHRDSRGQGGIQEGRSVDSLEGDEAEV